MRIKKFICNSCGAPKINEYKSPYIVCDFCGSFTDIDFTLGMDFWKASPEKTTIYQLNKIQYETRMHILLSKGLQDEYKILQREYWDFYYRCFPEYLPPSINDGEKYKLYLDIAAESGTYYAFDNSWKEQQNELAIFQQSLTYFQIDGNWKVDSTPFFKMADFYIDSLRLSFKQFYSKPEFQIMHKLLPMSVHLKMKMSSFVQIWLPYLIEDDVNKFLKVAGFSQEYVEITPEGTEGNCEHCNKPIFIPVNSFKVYCESCHKISNVKTVFACMSCGAENPVPDNPAKPIDCGYCNTENRLIKPLFG